MIHIPYSVLRNNSLGENESNIRHLVIFANTILLGPGSIRLSSLSSEDLRCLNLDNWKIFLHTVLHELTWDKQTGGFLSR